MAENEYGWPEAIPLVRAAAARLALVQELVREAAAERAGEVQGAVSRAALIAAQRYHASVLAASSASSSLSSTARQTAAASLSRVSDSVSSTVERVGSRAGGLAKEMRVQLLDTSNRGIHRMVQGWRAVRAAWLAAKLVVERRAGRLTQRQRRTLLWGAVATAVGSVALLAWMSRTRTRLVQDKEEDEDEAEEEEGRARLECEEELRRGLVASFVCRVKGRLAERYGIGEKQGLLRGMKVPSILRAQR